MTPRSSAGAVVTASDSAQRFGLDDRAQRARRRSRRVAAGMLPAQQLVEQHAERVDVGRGRDRRRRCTCSGAAYFGVSAAPASRVSAVARRPRVVFDQLRDAEVEQLDLAVGWSTSTFDGLRSRWTIRLACAWATADSTSRNRRMRALDRRAAARRSRRRCARPRRARAPGTAGRCSRRRRRSGARCADGASRARMLPSRRKRSSPPRPTSAAFSSLTATWPSKRPSLRARQPHAAHAALADQRDSACRRRSMTPASDGVARRHRRRRVSRKPSARSCR